MTTFATRLAVIAAICGPALLAAPAAHAFTIENQGATDNNSNDSAKYLPDRRFSGSGGSQNTVKQGNTTIQFGGRPSFNQQYDSNRMFDPGSRLNDER